MHMNFRRLSGGVLAMFVSCMGFFIPTATAIAGSVETMDVINSGFTAWNIDGVDNPSLTLLRGHTYAFVLQNAPANHPFNINTQDTTGSGSLYNDGVTNNGATGVQTLTFVVPANAPDSLHYNCGNHAPMNGPITILTDEIFAGDFEDES